MVWWAEWIGADKERMIGYVKRQSADPSAVTSLLDGGQDRTIGESNSSEKEVFCGLWQCW
jgi:hypothetical protein